ncbi:uncharacterized protein F4817DRAFT_147615 [Daldinia loculata]|uniref:uncharacterized protein n=1 Tax=Daldinia loculata TaxID=103429 RepID=UPI0020C454F3|nr:uncharacterized protein F4817DRAFT_147615 [Daldinia loculata]KAI1646421.1 hypothetical protein F4817DRAFT_147615 [Daldinia loculata]
MSPVFWMDFILMIVIEVLSWNFLDEDYVISVLLLFVYTSDTLQVNTYKYLIIGDISVSLYIFNLLLPSIIYA